MRSFKPWVYYWLGVPLLAHPIMMLAVSMEDDSSALALFAAMLVAGGGGMVCRHGKGWFWEAALAGGWLPCLFQALGVYGALGMCSPAGGGQDFMSWFGWRYAPALPALAASLALAGIAGHLAMSADLAFKRVTGRRFTSFFG